MSWSTTWPGVRRARSSSSVSASRARVRSLSCSSCSLDRFMAPPHLVLCHRGVALKLLDGLHGNEVLGSEPADTDGEKKEAENKDRTADHRGGPIRRDSAVLQGGDTRFEQHDESRHDQDRAADDE